MFSKPILQSPQLILGFKCLQLSVLPSAAKYFTNVTTKMLWHEDAKGEINDCVQCGV